LPFRGCGASGNGAYHGEATFLTFTPQEAGVRAAGFAAAKLLYPPYGKLFENVLGLLGRLNG